MDKPKFAQNLVAQFYCVFLSLISCVPFHTLALFSAFTRSKGNSKEIKIVQIRIFITLLRTLPRKKQTQWPYSGQTEAIYGRTRLAFCNSSSGSASGWQSIATVLQSLLIVTSPPRFSAGSVASATSVAIPSLLPLLSTVKKVAFPALGFMSSIYL